MSINVNDLHFSYSKQEILKGVSFTASKGEMVFILGPNGAGKSTLFRCMLGQLKPSSGVISIDDKPLCSYKPSSLAKRVAYIPQSDAPTFNYTVLDMVVMGRSVHISAFASPGQSDYDLAQANLERMGIGHLANRGILEISGGERQLMNIARALVQQADTIIMDEPTANLDFGNQIRVQQQMKKLAREGILIIQSSHNPQQAMLFADRVIALKDGVTGACGHPSTVLTSELMYSLYGINVDVSDGMLILPPEN